jgi:hypothetical protein
VYKCNLFCTKWLQISLFPLIQTNISGGISLIFRCGGWEKDAGLLGGSGGTFCKKRRGFFVFLPGQRAGYAGFSPRA